MRTLTISLLGLTALALPVHAADMQQPDVSANTYQNMGFYLRGDIGWSMLKWSGGNDDDAIALGAGIGYQFNDNLRADIRGDWAGNYKIAPGAKMNVSTVLGNMYFDWKNDSAFTPYVGAGAGYGWTNVKGGTDHNGFAYALQAGVAVDLTNNLALDVGYRFRDVMISGHDPMEHQVLAGMRFKF
jgi:opacity protein-like surface antigen